MKKSQSYPDNLIGDIKKRLWYQPGYEPDRMELTADDIEPLLNMLDPTSRHVIDCRYQEKLSYDAIVKRPEVKFARSSIGAHCRRTLDKLALFHVSTVIAKDKGQVTIATLPISTRTRCALVRNRITTIEDLKECTYSRIMGMRGVSLKGYDSLIRAMRMYNIDVSNLMPILVGRNGA